MRKKKKEKQSQKNIYRKPLFSFRLKITLIVTALILIALIAGYSYINDNYTINTVYVEGNVHYSDEEIIEKIMSGPLEKNSIFLNLKYQKQEVEDIPFVAAIEIDILSKDTVKITVYEKTLAGFVTYLGRYMYFDKDGTIVESSLVKTSGVPEVIGLSFDHVVKYEKLPVEEEGIFAEILDISQSLNKYELTADKIYFDDKYDVTLYFEDVRVKIGDGNNIDEKFSKMKSILPRLEGKSGVLEMENYSEDTKTVSFHSDKPLNDPVLVLPDVDTPMTF
ncbi:MAG: FtsQ-type POTRA domain-containing protein [Lachnospiraceae bacterium]|nr:FtsQ-type POTRA domain-containing protein [Lachnospiraceae bacterium]